MLWLRVHAWLAIAWVVAIIVQVVLAGLAIGNLGGSGDFGTHIDVGYTIGIVQLAVLVTAFAARLPRREIGISAGILLLYIVQTLLPGFRTDASWIAALHPLNAMILFTLSIWYARRAWRAAAAPDATPAIVADATSAKAE
jgi:mercuric ion transport protein